MRKETVDIDLLLNSTNSGRKLQPIRITSGTLTGVRSRTSSASSDEHLPN